MLINKKYHEKDAFTLALLQAVVVAWANTTILRQTNTTALGPVTGPI